MPSKEELIKLIEEIDNYLGNAKEFFDKHEGEKVNIEDVDRVTALCVSTIDLLAKQYRLKRLLLNEYGVMILTKN
ncbi:hypothetical protein [Butyrivibrio sp. INlla21]|uniref:hypothetical protein n=1 Tax=Butyrivibrio sp. INlla21 TaxID=1520811 RepID=UPI0008E66922|nr:hypothetical protein [Butyrivibrio sp. INlla21]SFU31955.1 hypothetical protein SAMN02910342_00056 [Butyrivibrio sp. INlla21]